MIQNGITSNATNQAEEGEGEINDNYLLFYTQKKVSHLENEQTRLQTLLAKVIESIQPHVVHRIDEIIDYHHKKLQLTYDGDPNDEKICHIQYIYSDRIWKFKFSQLNPSDYQVKYIFLFQFIFSIFNSFSWEHLQNSLRLNLKKKTLKWNIVLVNISCLPINYRQVLRIDFYIQTKCNRFH